MKCKFCGNEVEKDMKFCPVCGTEVTQENDNSDGEQSGSIFEEPDKQGGYGYGESGYSQSDYNQGGYDYGQSDNNQGSYGYGQSNNGQGGDSYGQSDNGQGGYSYGQSGDSLGGYNYGQSSDSQGGYNYGQSDNSQGNYSYGQPDNNQDYSYGQPDGSQGSYGYGQPNGGQGGMNYGQPGNNQGGYGYIPENNNYNQPNYGQPNYGQPVEQISSTPYLIFSILTTICCCLPLGIASIVYASKINSLQRMGDYEGARDAAKKAKIFSISSAIVGVIVSIIAGVSGALDVFDELENDMSASSIVSSPWEADDNEYDEEEVEDEKDEEDLKQTVPAKTDENLGDSWKNYTIQINNTVLTFPCSISEVESTGLKMDTDMTPEDYVVSKDDYELVFFDDDNYNSLMFVVSNNTEEARAVKECTVNGIYVNDYDLEEGNITVIFPGDIQIGADIESVIEKWGEPDDFFEGDYADSYIWYDGDSLNCCMVSVDSETDIVTEIDLDGQELK